MKRKICVVTGTRAEYGLLKPVMMRISADPRLSLMTIATGQHLLQEFGSTLSVIKDDGFSPLVVEASPSSDSYLESVNTIGRAILGIGRVLSEEKPAIVLVLGDRVEPLAAAIAAAYLKIPVAHLHGGERTDGVMDESARHAITKFAHIHFPATKGSAERIRKLGEEAWRIHVVGAPGLDTILHTSRLSVQELVRKGFPAGKPFLLVIQHPTLAGERAGSEMRETLEAVKASKMPAVVLYPNSDPGGGKMIAVIREYERLLFIKACVNLEHQTYLSLLSHAAAMVGNSSSGIIEAPAFKVPAVNVGIRQKGRERGVNIIDAPCERKSILAGIRKALSPAFRKKMASCKSPYGDGRASERIVDILATVTIDERLLKKTITY